MNNLVIIHIHFIGKTNLFHFMKGANEYGTGPGVKGGSGGGVDIGD